jgi:cyclic pyranopterin phosphate synthase
MTGPPDPRGGPSTGYLAHVDAQGKAHMVDVTGKAVTPRLAVARCAVRTSADAAALLSEPYDGVDLAETARVAGIMAAKRTSDLIPLCHPIRLEGIEVGIRSGPLGFEVAAVAAVTERTGVEMEALTACAAAGLVLLQALAKSDPQAWIDGLTLWHKSGGRSGRWDRPVDDRSGTG